MTITNGYVTLAEFKDWLRTVGRTYTAATLTFTAATKTIADTRYGLRRFPTGAIIQITGTTNNNGVYTVATGSVAGSLVVAEALVNESPATATLTDISDPPDDAAMELAIEAASRDIDDHTARRFYAVTETRTYSPEYPDLCFVDDLLSVTTLKTDSDLDGTFETTWTTSDYQLQPLNAPLDGRPYTRIATKFAGAQWFTCYKPDATVEIAGSFGFCAIASVPKKVKEATLIQANRLLKRPDTPFGVAGSNEMGVTTFLTPKLDPDAAELLKAFRRGSDVD